MVYLDANVLVYPLVYEPLLPQAAASIDILRRIEKGEITAVTSFLSWDEVVWVVWKLLGPDDAVSAGYKLLAFPNLKFVDVDEAVVYKAQLLVERCRLKPRDAIHAASALIAGERTIVSDDSDFDRVRELERVSVEEFARKLKT